MQERRSFPTQPQCPRLILYHQTHLDHSDNPISILPVLTNNTGVTHVIIAAIHLNEGPGNITLNDHPPDYPKFNTLWSEVAQLQTAGVKVMGMLGGAAKGSYARLSGSDDEVCAFTFTSYGKEVEMRKCVFKTREAYRWHHTLSLRAYAPSTRERVVTNTPQTTIDICAVRNILPSTCYSHSVKEPPGT